MQAILFPLEKGYFSLQFQILLHNLVETRFKLQILMVKLLFIVMDFLGHQPRQIIGDSDGTEHVALACLDEMPVFIKSASIFSDDLRDEVADGFG